MAALAVAVVTVPVTALGAVAGDILLGAGLALAVAVVAGAGVLVHLLRQPVALYAPQKPGAVPAGQPHQVTAGSPRAIGTARRDAVITSMVLSEEEVPR